MYGVEETFVLMLSLFTSPNLAVQPKHASVFFNIIILIFSNNEIKINYLKKNLCTFD